MSDDIVITVRVGDQVHEANLTAMFSADHSDPIKYAKLLSSTYAVWAEIKEQAQELLTAAKNALDLTRAHKRLELDAWYEQRSMKPVGAKLEAQIMADSEVQQAIARHESARHEHEQAKVVTQTMWFQRSLITRDDGELR